MKCTRASSALFQHKHYIERGEGGKVAASAAGPRENVNSIVVVVVRVENKRVVYLCAEGITGITADAARTLCPAKHTCSRSSAVYTYTPRGEGVKIFISLREKPVCINNMQIYCSAVAREKIRLR